MCIYCALGSFHVFPWLHYMYQLPMHKLIDKNATWCSHWHKTSIPLKCISHVCIHKSKGTKMSLLYHMFNVKNIHKTNSISCKHNKQTISTKHIMYHLLWTLQIEVIQGEIDSRLYMHISLSKHMPTRRILITTINWDKKHFIEYQATW